MKEKRKINKQTTIEELEKEVREIQAKVNYDSGLVYKCDFKEHNVRNTRQHNELKALERSNTIGIEALNNKMDLIYPKVSTDIRKAEAYSIIINDINGKTKSSKFWIQVIIYFIIGIAGIIYAISFIKSIMGSIK